MVSSFKIMTIFNNTSAVKNDTILGSAKENFRTFLLSDYFSSSWRLTSEVVTRSLLDGLDTK